MVQSGSTIQAQANQNYSEDGGYGVYTNLAATVQKTAGFGSLADALLVTGREHSVVVSRRGVLAYFERGVRPREAFANCPRRSENSLISGKIARRLGNAVWGYAGFTKRRRTMFRELMPMVTSTLSMTRRCGGACSSG